MSAAPATDTRPAGGAIPWRVAPPLISTALVMVGAGVLGSLLPLRFSAMGLSPGVIGLIANFDLVPREMLQQIWKLWPLIPLILGLAILVRRGSYANDRNEPGTH